MVSVGAHSTILSKLEHATPVVRECPHQCMSGDLNVYGGLGCAGIARE